MGSSTMVANVPRDRPESVPAVVLPSSSRKRHKWPESTPIPRSPRGRSGPECYWELLLLVWGGFVVGGSWSIGWGGGVSWSWSVSSCKGHEGRGEDNLVHCCV